MPQSSDDIFLGSLLPEPGGGASTAGPTVFYDSPLLRPHRGRPWLEAHLWERHRIPPAGGGPNGAGANAASRRALPGSSSGASSGAYIAADTFRYHGLLSGSTGGGKTRLALHLLTEQLRRGCSLLAIDPKEETLGHLAHCARAAGLADDQVSVLLPGHKGVGCPGWNPLDFRASGTYGTGVAAYEAVAEFVKLIEASSPSWGARMADLLKNAARLAAYHGLSLQEMVAILRSDEYREGLLRSDPPPENISGHGDRIAYEETRGYFAGEFASWSAARRAEAVDPVLNKVRTLLDIPFLRALLCAPDSTLDLPSLWRGPRQRVVLVHLDFRALGGDGATLLAGLLSYSLFQTAMRVGTGAPRPVILYLDELGIQERFVGTAIRDILAMARSFNLRLLVACQHLGQLSPELKQALLTVAFRAFFRLGPEDAKAATAFLSSLAPDTGSEVSRLTLDVQKGGGKLDPPVMEKRVHRVQGLHGEPVHVPPLLWEEFERFRSLPGGPERQVAAFRMLLSRVPRVYVSSPIDGQPFEIGEYLRGVPGEDISFSGPDPLRLIVRFPRPKVTVLERVTEADREKGWAAALMSLKEREAAVVTPQAGARLVKVLPVELPAGGGSGPDWGRYLRHGQSAEAVERGWRWRREQMEAVMAPPQHDDDGHDEREGVEEADGGDAYVQAAAARERVAPSSSRGVEPPRQRAIQAPVPSRPRQDTSPPASPRTPGTPDKRPTTAAARPRPAASPVPRVPVRPAGSADGTKPPPATPRKPPSQEAPPAPPPRPTPTPKDAQQTTRPPLPPEPEIADDGSL
jgi:hypothetical protein